MDRKTIADKLAELYNKENQIYANPVQTRPKPKPGITGQAPDEEELGVQVNADLSDEGDTTKDLGLKGDDKDLGKGTKKDIGSTKKSKPKNWEFEGPRDSIHRED